MLASRPSRAVRPKLDKRVGERVALAASDEWGVLSTRELTSYGLTRSRISGWARDGRLHRKHRGVYAVGHPGLTLQGRFLAAVKACGPGAILSHYSAAALWRLLDWEERFVEVTVSGRGTRCHEGIHVHRTRWLERRDIRSCDGIWATTPARTVLDLAANMTTPSLRHLVRQGQGKRLFDVADLGRLLVRCGPRPGAPRLAKIILEGPSPTRSVLEDVVLDLILGGGVEKPDVNRPLVFDGRRVVPDFRWPRQRLIVEADGGAWHDNKVAREDDAERQAFLEAHGERVLRVSFAQAVDKPAESLARIIAAGAPCSASRPSVA